MPTPITRATALITFKAQDLQEAMLQLGARITIRPAEIAVLTARELAAIRAYHAIGEGNRDPFVVSAVDTEITRRASAGTITRRTR